MYEGILALPFIYSFCSALYKLKSTIGITSYTTSPLSNIECVFTKEETVPLIVREIWIMNSPTHLTANNRKGLCGKLQKKSIILHSFLYMHTDLQSNFMVSPTRGAIYFFQLLNQDWPCELYRLTECGESKITLVRSLKWNCFSSPS